MEWRLAGLMECLQGKLHNTGSITREGEDGGERRRERKMRERERRERGRGEEEGDNILHTIIWIHIKQNIINTQACGCISPSLSHTH